MLRLEEARRRSRDLRSRLAAAEGEVRRLSPEIRVEEDLIARLDAEVGRLVTDDLVEDTGAELRDAAIQRLDLDCDALRQRVDGTLRVGIALGKPLHRKAWEIIRSAGDDGTDSLSLARELGISVKAVGSIVNAIRHAAKRVGIDPDEALGRSSRVITPGGRVRVLRCLLDGR